MRRATTTGMTQSEFERNLTDRGVLHRRNSWHIECYKGAAGEEKEGKKPKENQNKTKMKSLNLKMLIKQQSAAAK